MPNAPLARPEAAPTAVEAKVFGMAFKAKPRHMRNVEASTNRLKAICIGAAGTLANNHTPNGVAMRQPMVRGTSDFQCTSFQMLGSRCRLAATSSMKIDGTISVGG